MLYTLDLVLVVVIDNNLTWREQLHKLFSSQYRVTYGGILF